MPDKLVRKATGDLVTESKELSVSRLGQQAWKPLRWRLIIAYFMGIFPVQLIFTSDSFQNLSFRKLSWPFFLSWVIFSLKIAGWFQVMDIFGQLQGSLGYEQTLTDIVALAISGIATFALGIIAHVVNVAGVPKLLDVMKAIEIYCEKYQFQRSVNITVWHELLSAYTAFCPVYMLWYQANIGIPDTGPANFRLAGFGLDSDRHLYLILLYGCFVFLYLEFAVTYLFGTLTVTSQTMAELLGGIMDRVSTKLEQDSLRMQLAWLESVASAKTHSWKQIANSCLEFQKVFEKFEGYAASKFILLYTFLAAGIVSETYYAIRNEDPLTRQFVLFQVSWIVISFYRIYILASSGEVVSQRYNDLARLLVRVNQAGWVRIDEKLDFEKLLTIVTSTPVTLSANGFFAVTRSNLPSITGAILTYIIVLLQFRMTDKTKIDV